MNKFVITCWLVLIPCIAFAQESGKANRSGILKALYWVKTLIDSSAVKGVDRSYVEQPKRPWAVEVRTDGSNAVLKMNADLELEDNWKATMTSVTSKGFTNSLGAWIGYRGYGFGWSKEIIGGNGSTFSLGATGGSFGINFRINTYRSNIPEFTYAENYNGEQIMKRFQEELDDPIKVRTVFLDGYYLFNRKHFSYAAAYDQSLIQRRSAGSLMVGAMYHHSSVDFSADSNWGWVYYMNGVGRLKFTQASIGVGYAYNWVPARGWLVNILAMPTLALYNRTTLYHYMIAVESDMETMDEKLEDPDAQFFVVEMESSITPNKVKLNFDARVSVVYNWQRTYLRVFGHYNRFGYGSDYTWGRLYDWKVYAALGIRF